MITGDSRQQVIPPTRSRVKAGFVVYSPDSGERNIIILDEGELAAIDRNNGIKTTVFKMHPGDLVGVAAIHYEPFGIYAGKSKDLKSIQDGAQIAVPNDPTNEGRALLLLQQEKLITLKDPDNLQATPVDIAKNPHNLKFVEVEAAAVARQLQDVDFAVINGNYAIEAGMHVKDAVAVEDKDGKAVEQYANYIVTTPDKKDDARIKALVKVLTSNDFKKYLSKTYGQDVLPAF